MFELQLQLQLELELELELEPEPELQVALVTHFSLRHLSELQLWLHRGMIELQLQLEVLVDSLSLGLLPQAAGVSPRQVHSMDPSHAET